MVINDWKNNMKRKIIIFCVLLLTISLLVGLYIFNLYLGWQRQADNYKLTKIQEETLVLKEVSNRTGKEFTSWLELREYVFCDLLKKGMTHEEIDSALSTIGDVRFEEDQVDYKNKYLYEHLSPIIMKFTFDKQKRLTYWSGSPETNFWVEKASCETIKK